MGHNPTSQGRWARFNARVPLWQQIITGLVLGVIAGSLLGERAAVFKPLGDLFINAIKMLIVPLVFSTLVVGITSMRDPRAYCGFIRRRAGGYFSQDKAQRARCSRAT